MGGKEYDRPLDFAMFCKKGLPLSEMQPSTRACLGPPNCKFVDKKESETLDQTKDLKVIHTVSLKEDAQRPHKLSTSALLLLDMEL